MNFLSTALHGSTTMVSILIGQILVVASLAMMTIWLLVRRSRYGSPQEIGFPGAQFVGIAPVGGGHPSTISGGPDQSVLVMELEKKCGELSAEVNQLQGMKAEYNSLQEKIKFLESKLLEYEILQEEIGTLSMLKLENEKLKNEISKLQAEIDNRVRGRAMPVEAPTEAPPVTLRETAPEKPLEKKPEKPPQKQPVIPIEEDVEPATIRASAAKENIEDIEPTAAPASNRTLAKQSEGAEREPLGSVSAASADAGGLDGLLSEIEALTADLEKDKKPK